MSIIGLVTSTGEACVQTTPQEDPLGAGTSPTLIGREVLAAMDTALVDLTVQLQDRDHIEQHEIGLHEAADKRVVQIRADRRDSAGEPQIITLESGAARQLIAALSAASNAAEDLPSP